MIPSSKLFQNCGANKKFATIPIGATVFARLLSASAPMGHSPRFLLAIRCFASYVLVLTLRRRGGTASEGCAHRRPRRSFTARRRLLHRNLFKAGAHVRNLPRFQLALQCFRTSAKRQRASSTFARIPLGATFLHSAAQCSPRGG